MSGPVALAGGGSPPAPRPTFRQRHGTPIRTAASIAFGLVLWEIVGRFVVTDRLFFVPFTAVVGAFEELAASGQLLRHISVSAGEFLIGFGLAGLVGVPAGIVIGSSRRLMEYLDPWISFFYAAPLIALTPFFILVFGIGLESKAAIAFTLAVFPALINAIAGIQAVDRNYLEVANSFNLSRRQVFAKVLVPASTPFIVSGLRLASGRALQGVVVGELFFSSAGVGHLISLASQTFDTAQLLAGVLIFAVVGVGTNSLLKWLEHRLAPWRHAPKPS